MQCLRLDRYQASAIVKGEIYAIFEQRITGIIEKHISKCPKGKRGKNERPVGINTKFICLKKLTKQKYGPFEAFDGKLLNKVSDWCKKRNELIHDLVRLDRYKEYDREFKELAESGVPLVNEMYKAATEVREWYRSGHTLGRFPEIKCKCSRRCIHQE